MIQCRFSSSTVCGAEGVAHISRLNAIRTVPQPWPSSTARVTGDLGEREPVNPVATWRVEQLGDGMHGLESAA